MGSVTYTLMENGAELFRVCIVRGAVENHGATVCGLRDHIVVQFGFKPEDLVVFFQA
jgi:hypothetical protein